MSFPRWQRWGPLSGVLAIACWIAAFALTDSPDTTDSDAKISAYFASESHQVREFAAFLVFVAGVLLLIGFLAALRERLLSAESAPGRMAALAFGAGIASAVLWLISVAMFTAPAIAANDTGKFTLDPNTFRLLNDLGYAVWVGAVVVAAIPVWATSAIALRSGLLPRWYAWLAVLAGVLQLFAIFFLPAFIFWGWVLLTSVFLTFGPTSRQPSAPAVR